MSMPVHCYCTCPSKSGRRETVVDKDKLRTSTTITAENRMTSEEVDAFLREPHIGRLATIREDGFPI